MMDQSMTVDRSKAEHVAQRLLERIVAAKLSPGSSFATESELLSQFNVSRPTLRESLRILESQGVLELRPGPGGGSRHFRGLLRYPPGGAEVCPPRM